MLARKLPVDDYKTPVGGTINGDLPIEPNNTIDFSVHSGVLFTFR